MKQLAFCLAFSTFLNLQAQNDFGWVQHYQQGQMYSVYERPGGYLFFALNEGKVFAGRTDPAGNLLQTILLDTLKYESDIIPVESGGFLKAKIVKNFPLDNTGKVRLEKFDSTGQLIWIKNLNDTVSLTEVRLTVLADGNYLAAGVERFVYPCANPQRLRVIKMDTQGEILWDKHGSHWCYGLGDNYLQDVFPLPDGGFAVLIREQNWDTGFRAEKYDASGQMLWSYENTDAWMSNSYIHVVLPRTLFPDDEGNIVVLATNTLVSGPAHSSSTYKNYKVTLSGSTGNVLDETFFLYPPTVISMFSTFGPVVYQAVGLGNGEMALLVKQKQSHRLFRYGSPDSSWQRPLPQRTDAYGYGFDLPSSSRPLRVIQKLSGCGALLIGGQDTSGLYLVTTDCWGNAAASFPVTGKVVEETDFDCATAGPHEPLPGSVVELISMEDSIHIVQLKTDASGSCQTHLTPGNWRVRSRDPLISFSGFSCQPDAMVTVDSTPTVFEFPVVRYKALLNVFAWLDKNQNCVADDNLAGYPPEKVLIRRGNQSEYFDVKLGEPFLLRLDTGIYRLSLWDFLEGPFDGYYCPTDREVHIVAHDQQDSVVLMPGLTSGYVKPKKYWDKNFNCQLDNDDFALTYLKFQLTDTLTGETKTSGNLTSLTVYPNSVFRLDLIESVADSLICAPGLPIYASFQYGDYFAFEPIILIQSPVFRDTLTVCAGDTVAGVQVFHDTLVVEAGDFIIEPYNIDSLLEHWIQVLAAPLTELHFADTTLAADSLQALVYTAVNGCDSTVVIHWHTTGIKEIMTEQTLLLYPNPAHDFVEITLPESDYEEVVIADFSGKVIWQQHGTEKDKKLKVNTEHFPSGRYLVSAIHRSGRVARGKLLLWR